jgi:D-alanine--poly(phosphoribitol) ligase subunit 1
MTTPAAQFYSNLDEAIRLAGGADVWVHHGERHSYAEMYLLMRRMNAKLKEFRGKRVVVYAGKCFPAYAAIYATLLSGNVWVPADPEIPALRNLEVFKQVEPALVLTESPLPDELASYCRERGTKVCTLGSFGGQVEEAPFGPFAFDDDDEAYIMFTSGSTGVPKGVPMTNRNYINFIDNAMKIIPFERGDVFADYHYFGFDISIFYIFCAILTQGCFAPLMLPQDRMLPLRHLQQHKITVLATVPSLITVIRRLARDRWEGHKPRVLFICGEPFRADLLGYLHTVVKAELVYNFYGLTETGVENFHHRCQPGDELKFQDVGYIPIGLPLPGNDIRLSPEGELLLAGCQMTPGYLGGRSPEKFFEENGVRWYRTGDKVIEQDGLYFCKGRLDNQVKLRGYRIELMDIEAQLRKVPGIEEAVCLTDERSGRDTLIAALYGSGKPSLDDVRGALKDRLPTYMIPDVVLHVAEMPLNTSGKIDRGQVRKLYLAHRDQG